MKRIERIVVLMGLVAAVLVGARLRVGAQPAPPHQYEASISGMT